MPVKVPAPRVKARRKMNSVGRRPRVRTLSPVAASESRNTSRIQPARFQALAIQEPDARYRECKQDVLKSLELFVNAWDSSAISGSGAGARQRHNRRTGVEVGDHQCVRERQRPMAASMIARARLALTTRPRRYDSSPASMPASSSRVSTGSSSWTGSTTERRAGSSRGSGGMTSRFDMMTRLAVSLRLLPSVAT